MLVGGESGIGKSTLLLQLAGDLAARGTSVLYVTSEESAAQTKLRAERLGLGIKSGMKAAASTLRVLAETNVERITHQIAAIAPQIVIIDSIQMIYKPDLPAAPGSVTQLRDCCMELVYLAKSTNTAVIFVGHVTKAGTLAGPKIIEHIVDTVVYFEGDRFHSHRIVRCVKNRFGSTHEVGLFEMTGGGLKEVVDPGNLFIGQHGPAGPPSGSVLTAAMQGTRVLLLEVQALTASSVIGAARRKGERRELRSRGHDHRRARETLRTAIGRRRCLRQRRWRREGGRTGDRSRGRVGYRQCPHESTPGSGDVCCRRIGFGR